MDSARDGMNSTLGSADNIIDELQEFLDCQSSKDDTPSDLELSISYSSSRTGAQTLVANGDGADRDVVKWGSFSFSRTAAMTSGGSVEGGRAEKWGEGSSLQDQSQLAQSSEVLMSSSSEVTVVGSRHSVTAVRAVTREPNPRGGGSNDGGGKNRNRTSTVTQDSTSSSHSSSSGGGSGDGGGDRNGTEVTDGKFSVSEKTLHGEGWSGGTGVGFTSGGSEVKTGASSRSLSSSSLSSSSAGDVAKNEVISALASPTLPELTEQTSTTMAVAKQNSQLLNGAGDREDLAQDTGFDFLQPSTSPPPPKEFRDSTLTPFPMIFRRSKKDPGSKQYNELVKELEQVLEKRNEVRRMRDDIDLDIPETVGSLRSSRKMSSSVDNLSIFSNKALLSRLESHFRNRGAPGSMVFPGGEKVSTEPEESDAGSRFGVVLKSASAESKTEEQSKLVTNTSSTNTPLANGHTSVSVGQSAWTTVERQKTSTVPSSSHAHSSLVTSPTRGSTVSVVKVSSDSTAIKSSSSHAGHVANGHTDGSSLSPHSVHEQERFSQDMSFGSDEDYSALAGGYSSSTLPNLSHYRKHHNAGRVGTSHLHKSSFSPEVMYRSQTLDSNFRHITRISVSKSMESLSDPDSWSQSNLHTSTLPHHQSQQDLSHRRTMDRQGSVPMKTIVEHFSETDPGDVPAWNTHLKNSKKQKDRGIHRSISQRVVQKIFRVIRPSAKPTSSAPVSRSNSFSPASQQSGGVHGEDSHGQRSSSRIGGVEDLVVELPSQQQLSVVPVANTLSRVQSRSVASDVSRNMHVGRDTQDGSLTVQLPNSHIAAIVPVSSQSVHNSSTWSRVSTVNSSGQVAVNSRTAYTLQRETTVSSQDNSLTVQLPNNHKANIVPTLPRTVNANTDSVHRLGVSHGANHNVTLVRSTSAASAYRQTYRPAEKGSPFTQEIGEGVLPPAHGDGLYRGEEDKPAIFFIDARGMTGEPSVQVDGPNSIAKCSIDPQPDGQYAVTYIPVEVGMFDVLVKWNGKEIHGSPFHPKVVCARKVQVVGGWQHYMDAKERVHLVVNEEKQIPFDTSEAGPGKMTAEVKSPSGLIPVTVDDSVVGRSTIIFTPREEGNHYIHLYWSDTPLVNSPFKGYATSGLADPSKVILTGRGLKEAIVREEAEFMIDASQAGPGEPEVQLIGVRAEVNVFVTPLGGGKFRCTYIPVVPGAYLLHITWNGRQLRGSPYKVNVIGAFYPNKVMVSGEGLKGGLLGRDLDIRIDTRKAGPGELTAYCMGPTKVAHCELEDHHDGTFRLIVQPQEAGRHVLQVKYGGEHVLGSPFAFKVSAQPDASKVRVSGPGVEHGILATFQSRFVVETRGAGAGQLTVRIRGPKGAFQVEMYRDSQKDRTILCRYDPCETGLYIISVRWSGVDVPGSPFHVHILDTQAELEQVLAEQSFHNTSFHSRASGYQWRDEF